MSDVSKKYQYVIRKIKDLDGDSSEYENQTYIGLTPEAGRYQGVIYKYGKVSIPEKENSDGTLPFRFEYDIVDNNGYPKEYFKEDFFDLIGDILVEIITTEEETTIDNDRTNNLN